MNRPLLLAGALAATLTALATCIQTPPTPSLTPLAPLTIVDASQPADAPQPRYSSPPGPKIGAYLNRPDTFFLTTEGQQYITNLIGWQNPDGGWFKNLSYTIPRPAVLEDNPNSGPPGDDDKVWHQSSTFDNDCTHSEMRLLARAFRITRNPAGKQSFDRALTYCFAAQYPNGGWPQRFPLQPNYSSHITLNDGAMTGVMALLRDIFTAQPDFTFCSDAQRTQSRAAFDRGITCLLNCQYRRHGTLTVWCQQHDEHSLLPAGGRAYELPALTANESLDVLQILEGIPNPNPRIRDAIEAAHTWYQSSQILGKRITILPGQGRTMIDDPSAPPLWARFYDPITNRPFITGRDGIPRARLEQITPERRNGYTWFSPDWGRREDAAYKTWKSRLPTPPISRTSAP